MKASELIHHLQNIMEAHGDLEVYIPGSEETTPEVDIYSVIVDEVADGSDGIIIL